MATIRDVARLAGVATSTVSHVINATRFVSPATTRAVRDAVSAVGYTPNVLARALARQTSNTVGLAVSSTRNRYFADVINAVEEECTKLGMMVLLANTRDDAERELEVVTALHGRRVDGIIIAPCCEPGHHALTYLRDHRIPSVMLDRLPDVPLDGVGVENREAVSAAVSHLVALGHGRIGFLAGQASFTTAVERLEGFQDGLRRHGLSSEACPTARDLTDLAASHDAAVSILGGPRGVTALVGGNNMATIGIMLAVRDRGLRIPQDVAVLGFDDFDWADAFQPRLTAIMQPCREIGLTAARMLKRRIDEPEGRPEVLRLAPRLIKRESCGHLSPVRRSGAVEDFDVG